MYADLKHQPFSIANQLFRSYRFYIMITEQCSFPISKAPIVPTPMINTKDNPILVYVYYLGLDWQLGINSWSGKNSVLYEMSVSLWIELLCHR